MDKKPAGAAIKQAAKDYLHQLKLDWRLSVPVFILPGIGSILVFYAPTLIVAEVIKRFSDDRSLAVSELLPYLLLFAGIWLLGEIFWRITIHMMIRLELRGIERLYNNAMRELLRRDLSFFHDNFAGSLTKRTIAYGRNFENFVDTVIFNVAANILPLLFISYVLWQFSPWLVLGLVGLLAITVALVTPFILRRQKLVDIREAAANVMSGHVADIYSNVDAVRAFANEPHESAIHSTHVRDLIKKSKRSWDYQNLRVDIITSPFYVLTNLVGLILAIKFGSGSGQNIAIIFVTFSYFATFTRIMWEFNRIYRQIESALTEAAQFTELLERKPTILDSKNPKKLQVNRGAIRFDHVNFRYGDNDRVKLFQDLNLDIQAGEKIGLVGRSGGGKTTITKLLLRFMDIDSGAITIDGQNIAQVKQSDLRHSIAYVPQDPIMFHRSLADNIRYGKLKATDEEVQVAAKRSHSEEFIRDMSIGYETLIGERGVKLSGGQRQRIAVARAMIKDAPILLLDEATSALDSESEKLIQDALWKLMEGRTAIVIAHRLSTIQKMDRIIVLDKGRIVEEGTHQTLLAQNGIYADLWAHQSGGFLEG